MAITSDIDWPTGLPCVLREGHTTRHASPLLRTPMASGRARKRRKFTSVPSVHTCAWLMTQAQAQAFEAWFAESLGDGVRWFNMPLRTPMGSGKLLCSFIDMYEGPDLVGRDRWRIYAPIEVWARPLLPPGWGLLPELVIDSSIIDVAVNREWPAA